MKNETLLKSWIKLSAKKQRGFTLLEYAAGAAVLMGLLYVGVQAMGGGIQELLNSVGDWARSRSNDLSS